MNSINIWNNKKGIILTMLFLTSIIELPSQGYYIEIKSSFPVQQSYTLSYYYGMKKIFVDSALKINGCTYLFTGDSLLDEGMYLVNQGNEFIELLVDGDQEFEINVDSLFAIPNITLSGADESRNFLDYQKYMVRVNNRKEKLRIKQTLYASDRDSSLFFRSQIDEINNEIKSNWKRIIEEYPNTLFTNTIKLFIQPEIPEYIVSSMVENADSVKWFLSFQYYRNHFMDYIVLDDERLLRIPLFQEKIFTYLTRIVVQNPDSLITSIDNILLRSQENQAVYKFLITNFLNFYGSSPTYGADEVFVHLIDNYYLSGKTTWVDLNDQRSLDEQATKRRNTIIGKSIKLPEIYDYKGKKIDLAEIQFDWLILFSWRMGCEKCKKDIILLSDLMKRFDDKNIIVLTLNFDKDEKEWEQFIHEYKKDFIHSNVWEMRFEIEKALNIYKFPGYLLLDTNNTIVLKPLHFDQLEKYFTR